ncbi:protein rigor mortis [Drosophila mojavensis]|uniref:Uncharacterized protein n=1 Tax=Drosophila mojavensis TaxID=7230 RepID=B4KR47_DROMO|nr:protein rigor mortis [Drosophila mojavensis]EDW08234.1 uncharacterized protein Dmoj_GI19852 [Drosophila mojavensis]
MKRAVIINNVPTPICVQTPLAVATPDGGLLYSGFKCINYIPAVDAKDREVKTMSSRITISGLDVSPLWGKQHKSEIVSNAHDKQFAIVGEDWSVLVWDCDMGVAIKGHTAHQRPNEARDARLHPQLNVLMSYICNGNILSMDAGNLVVYCVASNSYFRRPTFLSQRNHNLSVLSCSPYDEHIFAVGTTGGSILICNLNEMNIVHKLNGHGRNASICYLAWREMSQQPEQQREQDQEEPQADSDQLRIAKSKVAEADDIFDIYNYDHLESEFGAPASVRPRLTSKSSDDCGDFVGLEKPANNASLDFMEACESLKVEMAAHRQGPKDQPQVEVTLQDCQQTGTTGPRSDSSHNSERDQQELQSASEGSLEVIQFSSSSDDAVIVDGEASKPKREVLHHIYHQAEVHDAPTESPQLQQQQLQTNVQPLDKQTSVDTLSYCSTEILPPRPDILLASINDIDTIMIWNTRTGEHCAKNYSKSNATAKSKQLYWLNDHTIVSLSRNNLCFWAVSYEAKSRRYKITRDQLHKCSEQDIICCVASAAYPQIWLNMRNRRVLLLNPLTGQVNAVYGCLAYGVRAMSECPNDMNKIVLGCSDKRVAMFDISKLTDRCIPIESVHVNSAVYSLSWSPDCLQLAYGTADGIVGILDVERMRVKNTFRPVQKKEIYSLVWKEDYIYFIVNRMVGMYSARQPNQEALLMKHIERPSFLNVRGPLLLIGTENGLLQLHSRTSFEQLPCTALFARYVTDIAFSPVATNVFAVAGNDCMIYVLELHLATRTWTKLHKFTDNDSCASIASVKWSNQHAHLLLSFHIEGKVCMWSTREPKQPPLIIKYECPMWSGLFLPSDELIIMCGGKTLSLELVSIKEALASNEKQIRSKLDPIGKLHWAYKSNAQPNQPTLTAAQRKRQSREKRKANQAAAASGQAVKPELDAQQSVEQKEQEQQQPSQPPIESMMGALSLQTKGTNTNALECKKCKQLEAQSAPNTFLSHSRTCLCLAQKELNKSALEKLAIVLTEDAAKIDKSVLMSKLFSTKVMAKELVATELSNLKQSNNKDIAPVNLAVTTFKLREELEQHIANKTLNEWHISLAPAVSYVFWQICCKAYAQQMEEQGYILHAATYMLAVDMQTEAIEMLLKHEYFKEALINARIHLAATDPIIKTIINKWLDQLEKTGNYAAAALICVLDNEMLRGYLFLRKFRNRTAEIADLMEQIKRIGQLGPMFDEGKSEPEEGVEEAA